MHIPGNNIELWQESEMLQPCYGYIICSSLLLLHFKGATRAKGWPLLMCTRKAEESGGGRSSMVITPPYFRIIRKTRKTKCHCLDNPDNPDYPDSFPDYPDYPESRGGDDQNSGRFEHFPQMGYYGPSIVCGLIGMFWHGSASPLPSFCGPLISLNTFGIMCNRLGFTLSCSVPPTMLSPNPHWTWWPLGVVHFCLRFFQFAQSANSDWPTHPPPNLHKYEKKIRTPGVRKWYVSTELMKSCK